MKGQQAAQAPTLYPLATTERRLRGTRQDTQYWGETSLHQHGVGPPSAASIVLSFASSNSGLLSSSRAPPLVSSEKGGAIVLAYAAGITGVPYLRCKARFFCFVCLSTSPVTTKTLNIRVNVKRTTGSRIRPWCIMYKTVLLG